MVLTKKSKTAIIITMVVVLVVGLFLGIFCGVYFAPKDELLFGKARAILNMTFSKVELGAKATPRRVIDNTHPMNLVNHYGDESVLDLWSSIPDNQKPYTIILLVPGHVLLPGSEKALAALENNADECERNSIPYAIQNINGEIHNEERMPIAYIEQRFAGQHEYFYGLNGAELYNGISWRGDKESDQTLYIMNCIKLCAKYGAYFVWTDTNMNYDVGMISSYIENNESMYNTLKNYGEYVCMLNKESYGNPSTYALMQGLWLAGLIGNWGVASDWWHWQVDDDKKSLFGENDKYVDDEWDMILSYPENMYVQSMMLAMSRGGTCFKAEAPNFSTSVGGAPIAGFEYAISPLLDRLLGGKITIADKKTVLSETKAVIVGGENWVEYNYNYEESNLYPYNGTAGIVPLLPSNLRFDERAVFLTSGVELIEYKLNSEEFFRKFGSSSSNTYMTSCGNNWYYIHNVENARGKKVASFRPRVSGAERVKIETEEHTSAIITERSDGLSFYVSNYRTDKTKMIQEIDKNYRKNNKWFKINGDYLTLDSDGNPKGVDDTKLREVKLVIKGSLNGGKPIVTFKSNQDGSGENGRPFNVVESWSSETQELTITIMQNGVVELDIEMDDSGKSFTYPDRPAIMETKTKTDADVSGLTDYVNGQLRDQHNYNYYSYLNYDRAIAYAEMLMTERIGDEATITDAKENVIQAMGELLYLERMAQLIDTVVKLDPNSCSSMSYSSLIIRADRALREMLSAKPYRTQRYSKLRYIEADTKNSDRDYENKYKALYEEYEKLTKSLKSIEIVTQ